MPGLEELLTGRTLVKRYRIEEVIGRGGFAAVYRAMDERLGRPVAVKIITYPAPDADTLEQLRARFQREARAAASLPQHPNAVTVHDFGTDPDLGLDFLVMELLDGEDLATYLAAHDCPPLHSAMSILRAATEGIAVGHRTGLVHRDVKPGNIFLAGSQNGEPLRVCVLDFGIARVVADEHLTQLTKGAVPHSPAYASPEQLRGESDLTAASDVFSLGVVGYQLLSGVKPFDENRRGGSPEGSVPRQPLREANPEVPAELAAVIERAMAFDPADRYATAEEVAEALDAAATGIHDATLAGVPLPVPPPPDDATLLHPSDHGVIAPVPSQPFDVPPQPVAEPVIARDPTREPVVAASTPKPSRRRGAGMWVAVVLLALLAAGGVIWASTRGGGPDGGDPSAGPPPVALPDEGEAGEPVIETPVTGEIVEIEPREQPVAGGPPGSTVTTGTIVAPPPPPAAGQPPRPFDTRPSIPVIRPTIPPGARPTRPAQQQPQRDTAAADTARRPQPKLLGDPVKRDTTRRDTSSVGGSGR